MNPTPTTLSLRLAARPCGTNTPELAEHGIGKSTASGVLAGLVQDGRVFRVEGQRQPQGVVVHQFFASQQHAEAWARMAPMYRPNMRLRKPSRSSTSGAPQRHKLKRRDPDLPVPSPFTGAKPVLDGVNGRYSVPAGFVGEFGSMRPGQYVAEAQTCAARAVRA